MENGTRRVGDEGWFKNLGVMHTKRKKGRCIILRSTFCVCVYVLVYFSRDIIDG